MSESEFQPVASTPTEGDSILIVDDDERFATRLARAFRDRGFVEFVAFDYVAALQTASREELRWAVVDLRLGDRSGLELIRDLREVRPELGIVMLTGYGSITTAVASGRLGAINYLSKPTDADAVLAAFGRTDPLDPTPVREGYSPPSLARAEWEHINSVLSDCGGNVSEAARRLGLHRRTLQRKLRTLPPER